MGCTSSLPEAPGTQAQPSSGHSNPISVGKLEGLQAKAGDRCVLALRLPRQMFWRAVLQGNNLLRFCASMLMSRDCIRCHASYPRTSPQAGQPCGTGGIEGNRIDCTHGYRAIGPMTDFAISAPVHNTNQRHARHVSLRKYIYSTKQRSNSRFVGCNRAVCVGTCHDCRSAHHVIHCEHGFAVVRLRSQCPQSHCSAAGVKNAVA